MRLIAAFFIFTIALLCVGLGVWQVQRLEWKKSLLLKITRQAKAAPIPYQKSLPPFTKIFITGHYLPDKILYLNSKTYKGKLGYHLYQPFQSEEGEILWVKRGWIPQNIAPEKVKAAQNSQRLEGFLHPTSQKSIFRPDNPDAIGPNNPWYWLDLKQLNKITKIQNSPKNYYLSLTKKEHSFSYPIPENSHITTLPNNHLGYAITWFSLALAILIIGFISLKRR